MDKFLITFITVLLYIIIISLIKRLGLGSKKKSSNSNNCCPDCRSNLSRIKRLKKDKIYYYLALGTIDWRRYSCDKCGWEGLKWTKQNSYKKN